MDKQTTPGIGMNRTGAMISPIDSIKTKEGAAELTEPSQGDSSAMAENRIVYMKEADAIGSIPIPMTFKGLTSSIHEKLMNGNHAFVDKLGERLAFERTGTRLYEALLSKYMGSEDKKSLPELNRLEQFYLEELKHFHLACDVMKKIGGDPTAMTPAAAVSGTAAFGWLQVITDPRTSFLQSLEIILQAELVDNAGWELLIDLAEDLGLSELAVEFQQALDEEAFHLAMVKQWVQELTIHEQVSPSENFSLDEEFRH
jgi:hypothetical protein